MRPSSLISCRMPGWLRTATVCRMSSTFGSRRVWGALQSSELVRGAFGVRDQRVAVLGSMAVIEMPSAANDGVDVATCFGHKTRELF